MTCMVSQMGIKFNGILYILAEVTEELLGYFPARYPMLKLNYHDLFVGMISIDWYT